MSTLNEPIEVTIEKNGNIVILIDRHNLSAAAVLDMATRAMLGAGYDKVQVVQAALDYAKQHEGSEILVEATKSDDLKRVVTAETAEPLPVETQSEAVADTLTPDVTPEVLVQEFSEAQALESPAPIALVKEPETSEIEEVTASFSKTTSTEVRVEKTEEQPVAVETIFAPEPELNVEPELVAGTISSVEAPTESVTLSEAEAEVFIPDVAAATENIEVASIAVITNTLTEAHVPMQSATVLGSEIAPVSETPIISEQPSRALMEEVLAADQKRLQALINAVAKPTPDIAPNNGAPVLPFPTVPAYPKASVMADLTTGEVPPAAPAKLSKLTGFVKLMTSAIPRYPIENTGAHPTTPKPITPPVLAPPLSAPSQH